MEIDHGTIELKRFKTRTSRRSDGWGAAGLGAVLGLMVVVALGVSVHRALEVGTGFFAKVLCSGVFVSGRAATRVVSDELAIHPPAALMRSIFWSVDERGGAVRAHWFGLAERIATHDSYSGCSLHPHRVVSAERVVPADRPPAFDLAIGIDSRAQSIALAAFDEPDPIRARRTTAVVVVHRGRIVAEAYAPGYSATMPLPGWSMAKGVVNALAGIGVARGELRRATALIDLDSAAFALWRGKGDPRATITVDQALTMTTGLAFDESYANPYADVMRMLFKESSTAAYAATKGLAHAPGTHWQYASGTSNLLSSALAIDASGNDRVHRDLFARIGMTSAVFERDAAGTPVGSSFLYATARDWARFGWLYAADGLWGDERVLPQGWVDYSRTRAAGSDGRYGAHFWLGSRDTLAASPPPTLPDDLFYAAGHGGQRVTIIPSRALVVVRLGQTLDRGGWDQPRFVADLLAALPPHH
jgi:CubicO group peptidase (beta-lactamase class C family)